MLARRMLFVRSCDRRRSLESRLSMMSAKVSAKRKKIYSYTSFALFYIFSLLFVFFLPLLCYARGANAAAVLFLSHIIELLTM